VPVHRFRQGKMPFLMATTGITSETWHPSVRCITIHALRNHQRHSGRFQGARRGVLSVRWEDRAQAVSAVRVMGRYGKCPGEQKTKKNLRGEFFVQHRIVET